MKKRIIIPTLLSAALFTACVKDNESDSVKNYRDAQTENVRATTADVRATTELTKAKIETEKQEAAIKAQQAEFQKQLAEIKKIEAEQTVKQNSLTNADLELKIEKAKLEAEKAKLEAEIALAEQKVALKNLTNDQKAQALLKYNNALSDLNTLKSRLQFAELNLVSLKNQVNAQTVANEQIEDLTNEIAVAEAKKTALASANKNVQTLAVDIAKKEAEVASLAIAEAEALDKYNKARDVYSYDTFKTDLTNAKELEQSYFYSQVDYVRYVLADFLNEVSWSSGSIRYVIDYANTEYITINEGEFTYGYYKHPNLTAKRVDVIKREIAYRKNQVATYKTTLDARTTDLVNAKKATSDAKKAYEEATTDSDRQLKLNEYTNKINAEGIAQRDYDSAKSTYEDNTKDIKKIEQLLAYVSDLSPINAVISKYNSYKEGLKTTYFAYKKAQKAKNTANTELAALQATHNALTTGDVAAQIDALTNEIADKKAQIESLKANLTNKNALVTSQEDVIATLKSQIEATTKIVEAYKAQI